MEFFYSPLTRCEKSSYDSLWCRIITASHTRGSADQTLSSTEIFDFFHGFGFCDHTIKAQVDALSIPNGDPTNIGRLSKSSFYMYMRALSIAQHSTFRRISESDIGETKYNDIPIFRFDRYAYSPSSACEISAYESLWYRVNVSQIMPIDGSKVVSFALKSGLKTETLSRCWNIALENSGRHTIEKEEFFVFLRCISFVQITGIDHVTKEHILSTACRDFPIPDLDQNQNQNQNQDLNSNTSEENEIQINISYPTAFYFPTTKTEISAYNDFWSRASNENMKKNITKVAVAAVIGSTESQNNQKDSNLLKNRINAVAAVAFLVTSRLKRSM